MAPDLALHPGIDVAAAAQAYRATGQVRIEPFLTEESADALAAHLAGRQDWRLHLRGPGGTLFKLAQADLAAWSGPQLRALREAAAPREPTGFRYAYESIRVVEEDGARAEQGTLLDAFAALLTCPGTIALLREVVGDDGVAFADVFASRYRPGDLLTVHQDHREGADRIAAYVFGLTRRWRPEWGGLLLFHDAAGEVARGLMPRWNALTLFAVPQDHSVSQVAAFAPEPRLSLTGWLRPSPS